MLLRAVNVGGHGVVRPKALAERLSRYELINVGAAGSFVARKGGTPEGLRAAILAALGFETDVIILTSSEFSRLLAGGPAGWDAPDAETRRFVSFLAADPLHQPRLPLLRPEGAPWEVQIVARVGRAVLSLRRRPTDPPLLYPNPLVEKAFGVPATTRGWETVLALDELRGPPKITSR